MSRMLRIEQTTPLALLTVTSRGRSTGGGDSSERVQARQVPKLESPHELAELLTRENARVRLPEAPAES